MVAIAIRTGLALAAAGLLAIGLKPARPAPTYFAAVRGGHGEVGFVADKEARPGYVYVGFPASQLAAMQGGQGVDGGSPDGGHVTTGPGKKIYSNIICEQGECNPTGPVEPGSRSSFVKLWMNGRIATGKAGVSMEAHLR